MASECIALTREERKAPETQRENRVRRRQDSLSTAVALATLEVTIRDHNSPLSRKGVADNNTFDSCDVIGSYL